MKKRGRSGIWRMKCGVSCSMGMRSKCGLKMREEGGGLHMRSCCGLNMVGVCGRVESKRWRC